MKTLEEVIARVDRRPFRPFVVELVSGRLVEVTDPDRVVLAPSRRIVRQIEVWSEDLERHVIFDADGIAAIHIHPPDGAGAPEGS